MLRSINFAALFFLLLTLPVTSVSAEKPTQVYLDNGELNYVGKISAIGNKDLFELFANIEKKPKILSIRSKGGDTDSGIALGTWVHEQGLTVKVLEYCLSSCANYVFTAAPQKIVSNFAVVGFHGGLSSKHFAIDKEQEAIFAAMPEAEQAAARKTFDDEVKHFIATKEKEERNFFKLVGVSQQITTLGQSPYYSKKFGDNKKVLGWTFSAAGFEKLGVSNIRIINPPWRPKFTNSDFRVFQVDLKR